MRTFASKNISESHVRSPSSRNINSNKTSKVTDVLQNSYKQGHFQEPQQRQQHHYKLNKAIQLNCSFLVNFTDFIHRCRHSLTLSKIYLAATVRQVTSSIILPPFTSIYYPLVTSISLKANHNPPVISSFLLLLPDTILLVLPQLNISKGNHSPPHYNQHLSSTFFSLTTRENFTVITGLDVQDSSQVK